MLSSELMVCSAINLHNCLKLFDPFEDFPNLCSGLGFHFLQHAFLFSNPNFQRVQIVLNLIDTVAQVLENFPALIRPIADVSPTLGKCKQLIFYLGLGWKTMEIQLIDFSFSAFGWTW